MSEEQREARASLADKRKDRVRTGRDKSSALPKRNYRDPGMPMDMTESEQRHWHVFAGLLRDRGQLAVDSGPSLRKMAEVAAEEERLNLDVREHGMVITLYEHEDPADASSRMVAFQQTIRAEYKLLREARREYQRWLCHFGLTDATRGKVSANPTAATDPTDEFLNG